MSEHQLDDANVDAVGEQPAGAFVPQVVPPQVDALELLTVPDSPGATGLGLVAVGQELQSLPRRLDVGLVAARVRAEHERVRPQR